MAQPKRLFGLIGYPLRHSLSPIMHNAALSALRLKGEYKLFEFRPNQLAEFLKKLKAKNIRGFNVTIPYKEKIIPYLSNLSRGAQRIGAVNTVVVSESGRLKGYNTDCLGFSRHIRELKVSPSRAAVIGAGGASKAVCFALAKMKAQSITIYDIDKFRALGLLKQLNSVFPEIAFSVAASVEGLNIEDKDLLVNASPVGMKPEDPCLFRGFPLHKNLFIYDLIYNPRQTRLLALAGDSGLRFANGLGMLLYQGAKSFEYFTGRPAPLAIMKSALENGVKKL